MKPSLTLRTQLGITMTPQLQQAIRLLQLSTQELQLEIQQALESNMMLERLEEGQDEYSEADAPRENWEAGREEVSIAKKSEVDAVETYENIGNDIPEELPVDSAWDDIYDTPAASSHGEFSEGSMLDNHACITETLQNHLLWQVNLSVLGETDRAIAIAIIDALNSDGYLSCNLEEIRTTLIHDSEIEVELNEIETVLHLVQNLEPAGVGARNLGECLALQLRQLDPGTPWLVEANNLIANHIDVLAARDYTQLMRRMKLSREQLQQVIRLIQSLNPRPGARFQDQQTEYVVPDVYVRKKKGVWQVELNPDSVPYLRVNPYYAGMVRRADSSPDNLSLKTHLQEARWFIKSIQSRSETLLRVATAIVERQRAFLEHGDEAMKPLVLHDIAETLEMHESTISRVTTKKYMHTPRGIYELKYFFSSHLSTTIGGECSSTAIRAVIKKLIAAENPNKPLSDSKIAAILSEQGIKVARRTVAKYREAMTIPPSSERKQLM
jgi:RNA polymerase sigma-54 factor